MVPDPGDEIGADLNNLLNASMMSIEDFLLGTNPLQDQVGRSEGAAHPINNDQNQVGRPEGPAHPVANTSFGDDTPDPGPPGGRAQIRRRSP